MVSTRPRSVARKAFTLHHESPILSVDRPAIFPNAEAGSLQQPRERHLRTRAATLRGEENILGSLID